MVLAALVTLLVDGSIVPSVPTPSLQSGHVVVPVMVVARIADRVDAAPDGTLTVRRGEHVCIARPIDAGDPAVVAVAPLARCLGGSVAWDSRAKTLELAFSEPVLIRTMPPYDPNAPQVAPTTIFTPEPAPPTPRVLATGSPRPRRTAIPVTPSQPLTSPRP